MVPFFTSIAIGMIWRGYVLSALGGVVMAIFAVILVIRIRKLRGAAPDPTLSVSAAVEAQVAQLLAWERLKNTVGWRFFAPLLVGDLMIFAGVSVTVTGDPVSLGFRVRASVLAIVIFLILTFLHHRDARLKVRPVREELESLGNGELD